jgi:hypothetical protein
VKHWTKELGVTEEELKEFVRRHGVSVAKVRDALTQNKGATRAQSGGSK